MGSSIISPQDVLESLMNDGTIDGLRLKIINQLKANVRIALNMVAHRRRAYNVLVGYELGNRESVDWMKSFTRFGFWNFMLFPLLSIAVPRDPREYQVILQKLLLLMKDDQVELKKTTMAMVEQSKVLNTPGAEKQTKRELFDAL
ncbi:hypothetical protein AKJ16_DCAP00240 [Drosera capensis]